MSFTVFGRFDSVRPLSRYPRKFDGFLRMQKIKGAGQNTQHQVGRDSTLSCSQGLSQNLNILCIYYCTTAALYYALPSIREKPCLKPLCLVKNISNSMG
jgi:hypothetical protein